MAIISTSLGGRDRYLKDEYCAIVGDDPGEVAHAVQRLKNRNFDREKIRAEVLENLNLDRNQLLDDMDRLAIIHSIKNWRRPNFDDLLYSNSFELERVVVKKIKEKAKG